jgi:hypothetical protein
MAWNVATPLTGLRDMQSNIIPINRAPLINLGVFFSTSPDSKGSTPVPTTCDGIVSMAKQIPKQQFLINYKIADSTNDRSQLSNDIKTNLSLFRDGLIGSNIDQGQQITTTTLSAIQNYLKKIEINQIPVLQQVNQCLTETTIPDTSEYVQQANSTSESKDRLNFIKESDKNISYYEGWFPLFRPMKEVTLFALFATSLLLLLLAIGVFLHLGGVDLDIKFPSFELGSGEEGASYKPYIFTGIGLSVTVGLLQWYFQKQ